MDNKSCGCFPPLGYRPNALNTLLANALDLTAPATDALLKNRKNAWIQLSGHPGAFAPAGPHTIWKKRLMKENTETTTYQSLMNDLVKDLIPCFYREVEYNDDYFIEIEDLLQHFRDPAIMDIKMGTRTFLESEVKNPVIRKDLYEKMMKLDPDQPTQQEHEDRAITKLRYMQFREKGSSTSSLGFRIEAAKLPGQEANTDLKKIKSKEEVIKVITNFINHNNMVRLRLLERFREIQYKFSLSPFFKNHEVKMQEEMLELPLDVIKASAGFALDIGGSMAKLIYRSKEDYLNGELKEKEKAKNGTGILRQKLFARENIDEVLTFIKEHCDITSNKSGDRIIYSTGLGGNKFKTKIEEELNIQLENLSEMNCFVSALGLLLKTKNSEEIFKPVDEKGISLGEEQLSLYRQFKEKSKVKGKSIMLIEDKIDEYNPIKDCRFPFILAMCGSGFLFFRVEEDGSYVHVEATGIGGCFFLGLVSFMTGVTNFTEIVKLIEESNGRTADTFGSDLVDTSSKAKKGDIYSGIRDELRVFAFGKGLTDAKDEATKGDLIHSLLESVCENTARLVAQAADNEKVPRVYFCGNFVNIPKAQTFITKEMHFKRYWQKQQVNFEFVKNGGFLGAIGAFTEAYEVKRKAEKYQ